MEGSTGATAGGLRPAEDQPGEDQPGEEPAGEGRDPGGLLEGAGPADRYGRLAPEPEILLAIARAAELAWPRPTPGERPRTVPSWRFSGRWWSVPPPLRRDRPVR